MAKLKSFACMACTGPVHACSALCLPCSDHLDSSSNMQFGHYTYECKGEAVYQARPSRTQQLKNPKVRRAVGRRMRSAHVKTSSCRLSPCTCRIQCACAHAAFHEHACGLACNSWRPTSCVRTSFMGTAWAFSAHCCPQLLPAIPDSSMPRSNL